MGISVIAIICIKDNLYRLMKITGNLTDVESSFEETYKKLTHKQNISKCSFLLPYLKWKFNFDEWDYLKFHIHGRWIKTTEFHTHTHTHTHTI